MTTEQIAYGTISQQGGLSPARMAQHATLIVAVMIVLLHGLKPEIDPSWRFISEYALGRYGWLMSVAFVTFGVAHLALVADVRRYLSDSWPGRLALAALVVSAAGLTIAGVFTTDAVTADPSAVTMSGRLHNLGGGMGMAMPLAVALVTWQLLKHATWQRARRALLTSAALSLVGTVLSMVALGVLLSRSGGSFGPDVPVGWPNRLEFATYGVWFLTVARRSFSIGKEAR
jgi:MFS family permease